MCTAVQSIRSECFESGRMEEEKKESAKIVCEFQYLIIGDGWRLLLMDSSVIKEIFSRAH